MNFPFSEGFKKEAVEYDLKYRCSDCVHFDEPALKCSYEFPVDQHYLFYILDFGPKHVKYGPRFSFCKHFEVE